MNAANLRSRLADAYPLLPTDVRPLSVNAAPAPAGSAKAQRAKFKRAFEGKVSRQRGWLRWFALNHLRMTGDCQVPIWVPAALGGIPPRHSLARGRILITFQTANSRKPDGERQSTNEFTRNIRPGLLPVKNQGRFVRADVAGIDVVYFVGPLAAEVIVEVLWSYAVSRVVWIPFQASNSRAGWTDLPDQCQAFAIKRAVRQK
jgi:hypothetical protein